MWRKQNGGAAPFSVLPQLAGRVLPNWYKSRRALEINRMSAVALSYRIHPFPNGNAESFFRVALINNVEALVFFLTRVNENCSRISRLCSLEVRLFYTFKIDDGAITGRCSSLDVIAEKLAPP